MKISQSASFAKASSDLRSQLPTPAYIHVPFQYPLSFPNAPQDGEIEVEKSSIRVVDLEWFDGKLNMFDEGEGKAW